MTRPAKEKQYDLGIDTPNPDPGQIAVEKRRDALAEIRYLVAVVIDAFVYVCLDLLTFAYISIPTLYVCYILLHSLAVANIFQV